MSEGVVAACTGFAVENDHAMQGAVDRACVAASGRVCLVAIEDEESEELDVLHMCV
jgi:hypothetical protein